ncbi:hypothetical protein ACFFX1_14735 [Dactylosporangium sucinum]|uniref:hypothetical protein n=1 Tax=Dactylosporangium sucinum TaxID=1424081 RepID=UPI00167E6E2B|nr:hypothetical protein [Dactylosporangium sucinum]
MTSRYIPLALGEVGWLFPALTERTEHDRVRELLQAADETLYRLGQQLGARPDAQLWGVPLHRFHYQRLGPEPEFPVTILAGEGGADQIWVDILCAPVGRGPYHRPGPPWQVHTTISLSCDSHPTICGVHQVDARTGPPVETPIEAATEVQAAAAWLLQRLAAETADSLRKHDPNRGHPPPPRRRD